MEFLCPNGHKIQCGDERAGKAAKCPRCGVMFRIPEASESVPGSSVGGSGIQGPGPSDSTASQRPPAAAQTAAREPQIEFLCPNGHRLHGSAGLQGRPGECPECGARFRIPSYDEVSEEEKAGSGIRVGRADGAEESGIELAPADALDELAADAPASGVHPLAVLFARLWTIRPPGATVELRLADGETLLPEHYAPALSGRSHGVFSLRDPDGTHTLVAVVWDKVEKVQIRGIADLPDEMIG